MFGKLRFKVFRYIILGVFGYPFFLFNGGKWWLSRGPSSEILKCDFTWISWCWVHAPVIVLFQATKNPGFFPTCCRRQAMAPYQHWKAPPISSCSPGVIAFFWLIVPKVSQGPLAFSALQLSGFCLGKGKGLVGFCLGKDETMFHIVYPWHPMTGYTYVAGRFFKGISRFCWASNKYTKHMVWAILPMSQEIFTGSLLQYFPASVRITWMEDRLCFGTTRLFSGLNLLPLRASKIITKVWRV